MSLSPELAAELEFLVAERERLFASATKILDDAKLLTAANHRNFRGHLERLSQLANDYSSVQRAGIKANIKVPDTHKTERIDITRTQSAFDELVSGVHTLFHKHKAKAEADAADAAAAKMAALQLQQPPSAAPSGLPQSPQQPGSYARLPRLELPKFSGKLGEWSAFYGMFKVTVHDKPMSGIEKLSLLMPLLYGEAKDLISTVDFTDAGYLCAWDLLTTRYQSQKRFIYHHFSELLDLPDVKANVGIPQLLSKIQEHVNGLTGLEIAQATYETMLVTVISRKLSPYLRRKLDDSRPETVKKYPTLAEVLKFLTDECSQVLDNPFAPTQGSKSGPKILLSNVDVSQSPRHNNRRGNARMRTNRTHASSHASTNSMKINQSPATQVFPARAQVPSNTRRPGSPKSRFECNFCGLKHIVYRCEQLRNMTPAERRTAIRQKNLCENCLLPHPLHECPCTLNCFRCTERHHTLLCEKDSTPLHTDRRSQHQPTGQTQNQPPQHKACVSRLSTQSRAMVLPSAKVLLSWNGRQLVARALIDTCADVTIITVHCAQRLHLKVKPYAIPVQGLAECEVKVRGESVISLSTTSGELVVKNHRVLVAKSIAGLVPAIAISPQLREQCQSLELADPEFYRPQVVDVLIGVDLIAQVLTGQTIKLGEGIPIAMSTVFGYVLLGSAPVDNATQPAARPRAMLTHTQPSLSALVERFFVTEDVTRPKKESPRDAYVEHKYVTTTTQQENGRYLVHLPIIPGHPPLGTSLARAEVRYKSLERRFERDPQFHAAYKDFMREYEENGYMSRAVLPPATSQHFVLAHHGVPKKSSGGPAKVRVVFDASAPSSTNVSLNDILYPGPKLHSDIRVMIINFRKHAYVFTADIKSMFLQIDVHEDDRKYQMVVWRYHDNAPIQAYTLNTVTFGVNCSPFLSNRTLKQLAYDHGHRFPRAAHILLNDVYVDDILSGNSSLRMTREDRIELEQLLAIGGFYLHKWTASHPEILDGVPAEALECPVLEDPENPRFCLLGSHWVSSQDHFTYVIKTTPYAATKRGVLALTASIYDPLGWVAPVVLAAKAFIQELWLRGLNWDDPLPADAHERWNAFVASLPELSKVKIPRLLLRPAPSYQLHGYCDASMTGYAASLYLRSAAPTPEEDAHVTLVIARTKVAPKRALTLPKLELCAATLLADMLTAYVPQFKDFPMDKVVAWSDSTIALTWMQLPAQRLQTFVANRVAQIQELGDSVRWMHVPSESNPSDVASRGISPRDLPTHPLWWHGPSWLARPETEWPEQPILLPESNLPELKPLITALVTVEQPAQPVIPAYSTWNKTLKVTAAAHRFFAQTFLRVTLNGPYQPSELEKAETWILHSIQHSHFEEDFRLLSGQKPTSTKRISHLHSFIGSDGLIRVGGRLSHSSLNEEAKHPFVLPGDDHTVRLLVIKFHRDHLHPGPQLLQALLAQKFWILGGRKLCRHVVHQCLKCFKVKPRQANPLMGDLPPPRVQPNPVFLHTGVDLAGPIKVKIHQLRSARVVQVYLCIFVCLSVKAVHLEVVHDLTTSAFLAALHRFSARRGAPSDLYSDCGTNFVGASNEIKKILKEDDPAILHYAYEHSLRFHFNAPANPHAGGLWESAVKSAKSHMLRTIGLTVLILEEFHTLCQRIEAMLNSRPLTPSSVDPSDLTALTPGHFIIGRPLVAPPEQCYPLDNIANLHRWQRVHAMFQHIWHRWQLEYIQTLQPRKKWREEIPSLVIGTLVLIHDPSAPPLAWRLGRVVRVYPGADGHVRVADVKTATGELKRPVHKLYPLPSSE